MGVPFLGLLKAFSLAIETSKLRRLRVRKFLRHTTVFYAIDGVFTRIKFN
jgi:hypothetical protein